MYKDIIDGKEKTVSLVKAVTVSNQLAHVVGADLVIWACGYQTKPIPIKDQNGNVL
jgi:hypothetical protein